MTKFDLKELPSTLERCHPGIEVQSIGADEWVGGRTWIDQLNHSVVIRPQSREQLADLIRTLQDIQCSYCTWSTGKNWGFGSARWAAGSAPLVAIDLSRLNRVLHVNEELAYAVIEPGVTQGVLEAHLAVVAPNLELPVTSAGPKAGIVGSILDRGHGYGKVHPRTHASAPTEVILKSGKVIHPLGEVVPMPAYAAALHGEGPDFSGVFIQSDIGVVTALILWLDRKCAQNLVMTLKCDTEEMLAEATDVLREVKLRGELSAPVHHFSWQRLLTSSTQLRLIPHGDRSVLYRKCPPKSLPISCWTTTARLSGSVSFVEGQAERMNRILKNCGDLSFEPTDIVEHGPLAGVASDEWVRSAYWASPNPIPAGSLDPSRDRCGLRWVTALVPARGREVIQFINAVHQVLDPRHILASVAINQATDRVMYGTAALLFDPNTKGDALNSRSAEMELVSALGALGLPSYRSPGDTGDRRYDAVSSGKTVLCELTKTLLEGDGTWN